MKREEGQITHYTSCYEEMIGPDMNKVLDLIERGKIPLLGFTKDPAIKNDLVLEVTDSTQCQEYATISHVWSDVYSNADYNKLY